MNTHINKFVDRVRGAEARGVKDLTMNINDARDLHADITRLLLELNSLRESVIAKNNAESVVTLEINGGTFQ